MVSVGRSALADTIRGCNTHKETCTHICTHTHIYTPPTYTLYTYTVDTHTHTHTCFSRVGILVPGQADIHQQHEAMNDENVYVNSHVAFQT